MEAQGSQTATLASQRLTLALREADSEVTTGAWEKPDLWACTVGEPSLFLGLPSLCQLCLPITLS